MPKCHQCGKEIEKLPPWLDDVKVTFRCASCADSVVESMLLLKEESEVEDPTKEGSEGASKEAKQEAEKESSKESGKEAKKTK